MRAALNGHAVFVEPDVRWKSTVERAGARGLFTTVLQSSLYSSHHPGSGLLADARMELDVRRRGALARSLAQIHAKRQISVLLVSSDGIMRECATTCEHLGVPFTSREAIVTFRDKALTRQLLDKHNLPSPRWRMLDDIRQLPTVCRDVGFPCVVKPRSGHLSLLAWKIPSSRSVRAVVRKLCRQIDNLDVNQRWILESGFVCESWLEGPVISVELAVLGKRIVPLMTAIGTVQDSAPCSGFGNIMPALHPEVPIDDCIRYAISVCATVSPTRGVWDVELVLTSGGPVLLEVNPRKMGGEMLMAYNWVTGESFEDVLLDVYSGQMPIVPAPSKDVVAIRKLMASTTQRVRTSWDASPLYYSEGLRFVNYAFFPGAKAAFAMVMGRLLVKATSMEAAFERLDQVSAWIGQQSGVRLIQGALPELKRTGAAQRSSLG